MFWVFLLIGFITSGNYVSSNSCDNIAETFARGQNAFLETNEYAKQLAEHGFLMEPDDPGYPVFIINSTISNKFSCQYEGANRAVFGMNFLYDKCVTNDPKSKPMTKEDVKMFFESSSQYIPIKERSNCIPTPVCDPAAIYRNIDASCNNLNLPLLGTPYTAFIRKIEPFYENYVSIMRRSVEGGELPSPRLLVNAGFLQRMETPLKNPLNILWYFYGQFLTHDVAFAKNIHPNLNISDGIRCCSSDFKAPLPPEEMNSYACSPIDVPKNDKFYGKRNVGCLNYVRSERSFSVDGMLRPADQVNRVTGFIDLSLVYGLNDIQSRSLRTMKNGALLVNSLNILPELDSCPPMGMCYLTGDERGNQTPQLALLNSLYVRFHNIIARVLQEVNPSWDDEKLFQESRRIAIAVHQKILFKEYYYTLTGKSLNTPGYTKYDQTKMGTVLNEFTTGVFRTLHFFTPPTLLQYDSGHKKVAELTLAKSLFASSVLQTNYNFVLNGMLIQHIRTAGLSGEITNEIFNGFDLFSFDVKRGRDHGLQSYTAIRRYCGFSRVENWEVLKEIIPNKYILNLRKIYQSVKDIDLIVGLLLEKKDNMILGPTSQCLLEDQFQAFRNGDRFFYTHDNGPYPFTKRQLNVIKSFTMAQLICLTTSRTHIRKDAFYTEELDSKVIECKRFKTLDLSAWKDE